MLEVTPIAALRDNYIWMIHAPDDPGRVLVVDPGESAPVAAALAARQLKPAGIVVTHHHPDHTGGVAELVHDWNVPVYGPTLEARTVVTHPLGDGERLERGDLGLTFEALHVPGHTLGHTAFFGHGALFCGDTLFSAGCGRLFEGTAEQMRESLARLAALPATTRVYCGHEYTAANLAFAATVEPNNPAVARYREAVNARRQQGEPSLPSSIGQERQVNPFLRTGEPDVRRAAAHWAGEEPGDEVAVLAALRRWKDGF